MCIYRLPLFTYASVCIGTIIQALQITKVVLYNVICDDPPTHWTKNYLYKTPMFFNLTVAAYILLIEHSPTYWYYGYYIREYYTQS